MRAGAGAPTAAAVKKLDAAQFAPDELEVAGREVYLHYPDGLGRSKLTNAVLERRLGVAATMRNWRTVTTLADARRGRLAAGVLHSLERPRLGQPRRHHLGEREVEVGPVGAHPRCAPGARLVQEEAPDDVAVPLGSSTV